QFLEQLLADGRLRGNGDATLSGAVTYHDPCYLARVNGIHQAPRNVLNMTSSAEGSPVMDLREMARSREKTFCCGAGGGRMWMEEEPAKRVCEVRSAEALGTGATIVAVGWQFCITMMSDGVGCECVFAGVVDVAGILGVML